MALFMAAGSPEKAALFDKEVTSLLDVVLYVSPDAASFAGTLIHESGGVECPRPDGEPLTVLAGHQQALHDWQSY